MTAKPIILVNLSISHEKEAEFNDFYHHVYIPKLMEIIPEIETVRRYEEYNIDGLLRFYHKQYLTIYETAAKEAAHVALDAILHRPGRENEKAAWEEWEPQFLSIEHAAVYVQTYAHPRETQDGPFGSRPFFSVTVETRGGEEENQFNNWYENIYLPKNMADVPTWAACRRYCSVGGSPSRGMTIYEAGDEQGLQRSLELMRAPHRFGENSSWTRWDAGAAPVIIWEDATRFRPIFRYPR